MGKLQHSKAILTSCSAIAIACALTAFPEHGCAQVASIPAVVSPDVYTILSQNPALATLPAFQRQIGQFTSLTVIGDSFGDQGNALRFNPISSQVGANGRYGNALNIIDGIQFHYGLSNGAVTNYAFGGATTGATNNNPPALGLPGFAQEVASLVASGRRFGPTDLVSFTTAGVRGNNDATVGISAAQGIANVVGYVQTVTGLGARTIQLNALPGGADTATNRAVTQNLAASLVPFANAGVRVLVLDGSRLIDNILASPTRYGFPTGLTSVDYCTQVGGANVCNEGRANKARLQTAAEIAAQNQYLYFYAHPTTRLASIIAAYATNQLDAPGTVAPQAELGRSTGTAFANSLLNHLDAYRWQNTPWTVPSGYSADLPGKAPLDPVAVALGSPFSLFVMGTYANSDQRSRFPGQGYDYDLGGVTVGGEYRATPNLLLGAAFNYSNPDQTVNQSFGRVDMNAYQGAGYASLSYPNWYVDGIVTYGSNDYRISRPGVLAPQTASPSGETYTLSVKAGYLFDLGAFSLGALNFDRVQLGPIAGLIYANTSIDPYTEQGDDLLNQGVRRQNLEGLTGSAGLQLRYGYGLFGLRANSFLNLTAEHEFLDGVRTISTFFTSVPTLVINTGLGLRREETYGKVASGLSADFTRNLSGMVSVAATFGRDRGEDYLVNAGLRYRF